jgi:hypothetical protein
MVLDLGPSGTGVVAAPYSAYACLRALGALLTPLGCRGDNPRCEGGSLLTTDVVGSVGLGVWDLGIPYQVLAVVLKSMTSSGRRCNR